MSKRFVSWIAVSSHPQAKKISLSEQRRLNQEHIDRHGGECVADLEIPGESRNIVLFEDACTRIGAYAELRDLIERHAFDVLIYYDRSRLGRKASLSMAVVELCHEAGILTYEVDSPPASLDSVQSTDDLLLGAIKSVNAQQEIRKMTERHKFGMIGRVRRGEFPGNLPYGYSERYDEDGRRHVEVNAYASSVVRRILVDMFLNRGLGRVEIAKELNEAGILSPEGVTWKKQNVAAILDRVWRYAGWSELNLKTKHGRPYTKAKGNWQPIISQDEAEAIHAERQRRRTARRSISDTYLFSMCVYCAVCGRRMAMCTGITNHNTGHVRKMLRCYQADHDGKTITERAVYRAVRHEIESIISDPEYREHLLNTDEPDTGAWAAQIADVQTQIKRARAGLNRADDAYTAGDMDYERYQRQVRHLREQIDVLEAELTTLQDEMYQATAQGQRQDRLQEVMAAGLAKLDDPDVKAANAWLRRTFRVWARDHQVVRIDLI